MMSAIAKETFELTIIELIEEFNAGQLLCVDVININALKMKPHSRIGCAEEVIIHLINKVATANKNKNILLYTYFDDIYHRGDLLPYSGGIE